MKDPQLSDFLFYLIYETPLDVFGIKEDIDGNWEILHIEYFVNTLKAVKCPYSLSGGKVTVSFKKMNLYIDVRSEEDKQYFLDLMEGVI